MLIKDVVRGKNSEVFTIKSDDFVVEAADIMAEKNIGIVVVCTDDKQILGVLSERDIIRALAQSLDEVSKLLVGQLFSENPISCSLNDEIFAVLNKMKEHRFRHMPVVQFGKVVSLVSAAELLVAHFGEIDMGEEAAAWSYLEYL